MLPEEWRDRFPAKIAQDQSSHTHPAAGQIFASLAQATGVNFTNPRFVVVPDDPDLGEFRKTFAGEFGTIDEYPLAAAEGRPGFKGATEIISTTDLWHRWLTGPENRSDSRAFLKARALDLWLDNYDDHRDQWRWMRIPGQELWQPLTENPDMVLAHHDGMLSRGMRGYIPKLLKFTAEYPGKLEGPLQNSFEVDRWLLSDLDAAAWQEVAKELHGRLTDDVIDRALRQMPPPWYAIDGADKLAALKTRRAGLVDYILRVYRYYAKQVDVHATDKAEVVTLARGADDSMEITIALAEGSAAPWYRRRFLPGETDEVRVHLHGGNDRVARTGPAGGPVHVRVVAGGGQDVVDDSKSGGTDVWRDAGTVEVERGQGTQVRRNAWTNPAPVKDAPWLEPRSHGHLTTTGAIVAYHPDIRLVLGYGFTRTAWGFRTRPASSVQTLRGAIATGEGTGKIEYEGTFRRMGSGLAFRFETFASDIEQFNFFGYGNDLAVRLVAAGLPCRGDGAVRPPDRPLRARPMDRGLPRPRGALLGDPDRHRHHHRQLEPLRRRQLRAGGDPRRLPLRLPSAPRLLLAPQHHRGPRRHGGPGGGRRRRPPGFRLLRPEGVGCDGAVRRRRRRRDRVRRNQPRPRRRLRGWAQALGRRPLVRGCRHRRLEQPGLPQPPLPRRLLPLRQRFAPRVAGPPAHPDRAP